jgi:hypothetical protein
VKKTSLYLEEELDHALARLAAEEGLTKAEFIRRGLEQVVNRPKRPKPKAVGVIKGAPADVSENVDEYLAKTGFGDWRRS